MVIVANKSCVLMRSGLLVAWQKILGDGLMIGTVWKLHRVNASSGRSVALMIQTRRAGGGGTVSSWEGSGFSKSRKEDGPVCVGRGSCWIKVVRNKERWRSSAATVSTIHRAGNCSIPLLRPVDLCTN